jgi:hypothetical protein
MIADVRSPRMGWGVTALGSAMALAAALAATGCKQAAYVQIEFDGGGMGAIDGGALDASASEVPATSDTPSKCSPNTPSRSKGKAESCSCDRECQTGFCADGVCCTSACGATCMACNLASSLGDCAFVPAGLRPDDSLSCTASTPATCGQDGTCDGKGGCRLYVKGTECKAGVCDGDAVTGAVTCDGIGNCAQAISQTCPPYSCEPATNRCATNCTTDAQCAAGKQCVAGRCGKSANGALCQAGSDCASGFCVDGVCCNIACSGACVSCSQTGSVGHCTYIAAGLPDPACQAADRTTCGTPDSATVRGRAPATRRTRCAALRLARACCKTPLALATARAAAGLPSSWIAHPSFAATARVFRTARATRTARPDTHACCRPRTA